MTGPAESPLSRFVAGSLGSASLVRKMFEEAARLRALHGADAVVDLSLGNPHLEPPAALIERLRELTQHPRPGMHRYMPNAGFPEVRQKIADHVGRREGVSLTADQVVMTTGAASALNVLLRTILDPGDEVILFAPYFAEYPFYVGHAGGVCRIVETTDDFDLDVDALAASMSERTRAVLINSPNNPTGRVYPEDSIQRLCSFLERDARTRTRPIVLLADDPYRRLVYDGCEVPSVLSRYRGTILATSFSKDLGLAGERIGYLAVHPEFPGGRELFAGLVFCLRTLGFVNAPALMQLAVADCLDAAVDIDAYKRNRDELWGGLTAMGYQCVRPEGAFFLFPKTPLADDVEFCARLRAELLLAVPGVGFARPGHMRLSYAVAPEVLRRSLPIFERVLRQCRNLGRPRGS